jgi:hypothetical protein
MDPHDRSDGRHPATAAAGLLAGAQRVRAGNDLRLADRLDEWRSAAVVEEAARNRSRRAWIRRLRDEDRSVVGVLLGAVRTGDRCCVGTVAGELHSGVAVAVGADVLVLDAGGGTTVFVALDAVTAIGAGRATADGDRAQRNLGDALRLLDPGTELRITTRAGGTVRSGRLVGVGTDVVTLERDVELLLHVPLSALVSVRIDEPLD